MRTSFFKEVRVKSLDSHRIRTLLGARAQLVGIRTDLKNQVRSVLKTFGFVVSQSVEKGFEAKVRCTVTGQPLLRKMVNPLMEVLQTVQAQVTALDKLLGDHAENDKICSHLMTIPGRKMGHRTFTLRRSVKVRNGHPCILPRRVCPAGILRFGVGPAR
jgi:transposase